MPKPSTLSPLLLGLLLSLLAFSPATYAMDEDQHQVTKMLAEEIAPDGVVFELIGDEDEYLLDALKKVSAYKAQLQEKFPDLEFAVVSHGAEQFNLTTDRLGLESESHEQVRRLVESNTPVHVCETHASWRGVTADDFPDYITVSATGPAQIRQYQELGYTLVVIE